MERFNLIKYGVTHPIQLSTEKYLNGNLAIRLISWEEGWPEPWSNLTVNLDTKCKKDCAFVDTNNNGKEILKWIAENNLGEPTGRIGYSGYCEYPEYKFNAEIL